MCGIAGILGKSNANLIEGRPVAALKNMLHMLEHRGPDDYGIYHLGKEKVENSPNYQYKEIREDYELLLGHRRLSIIDLSKNGHQPMHSADGKITIIFNGEIYNYIELREELKNRFTFYTNSDTEVLINAYRAWGKDCFSRLDGMFSLAIWDHQKQTLLCARDPIGIKPFYYSYTDDSFIFASEPKAILSSLETNGSVNYSAVSEFLVLGISDHDASTSYNEISQLPGGHFLEINRNIDLSPPKAYWTPPHEPESQNISYSTLYEKIRQAVERQLRSDVQVGSSLSGGIDSGTLVKISGQILNGESEQYKTITFTSNGFINDESMAAKLISESSGMSNWNPVQLDEGHIEEHLIKLISDIGEPFTSLSILAQNLVMKEAQKLKIKVMLDGQGGDEVYLGYPRLAQRIIGNYFKKGQLQLALQETVGLSHNAALPIKNSIAGNFFFSNATIALTRNKNRIANLVKPDLLNAVREEVAMDRYSNKDLQQLQIDELTKYILPRLLKYADRNSMAYSVESRVPHLSVPLVEYALKIPYHQRVKKGWTKYAVRKAMNEYLPKEILWAKEKKGFDIPQKKWITLLKPQLIKWISEYKEADKLFNTQNLIDLIKLDKGGEIHIWRIISVILWMKFLDVKN